ncbi:DNA helicase II [Dasania sp. GY-MA-18]|uniref:DNA 3'-5' helicase n=1 Tax=Dasania phycosphaerae TaxID=2950436 RepID=A0A9J6RJR5_9GAMM|nr:MULTISPECIES: DNA helicase II [Dasania]MCR8922011.1 DNA helicase II [Dasania sp. GY-MA-18]MCZ0864439.1 DNA helicase II [Dasania phycosphaerae]MCZ0868167.1 DNA helicase II [Dasania phycosphaerae]
MDVSHILNDLNDAQRQAVAAPPSNMLILAGAGSGKTRVLVHRIAWLIQAENMAPQGILAVTFTNKAAREMRERIDELLNIPTRSMWVGTFHGLAHRLLKAHWQDAGLPQNFQILDSDDQLRIIKRIHKELALDETKWPPKQSQWFINGQKDEGKRAAHIEVYGNDLYQKTMLAVYLQYEQACERQGVVDFAELLLRAHELWLKNPRLLAHYQQRFQHILVDEFQDTNAVQYAWLRVLAGKQIPIAAVGDDDQSIYGWRGAKIENIQQFARDFANTQVIKLEQNYRSTATILGAANAVIANNTERLGKELWTEGGEGEPISLYTAFNEQDEARFVVERIEEWVKQGELRAQSAILYRSNAQSRVLEEALIRAGMPYRIYGGQRFYDRLEIKNALAYMRLINNRHDDTALERVINTPTRGIGGKTVDVVRSYAREHGSSMWQALANVVEQKLLPARASNALLAFVALIDSLDSGTDELSLDELADEVIKSSGLIEFHKKEKGEKGQARVENLQELVVAAKQFDASDEELSPLQQFLDEAALDAGEQQADEYEDSVQLMTLHSAKGLEFPLVCLVGMEENLFPHKMSMDEASGIEEERRLCYVGITRAMQKLYLSYAESRRMYGNENFNAPSRFIREIPTEYVEEVRLNTTISRPASYAPAVNGNGYDVPGTGISLGQPVFHQIFGSGTVVNFEGQGSSARVQVNFDDEGSKWLVLQYANLEAL